MRQLAALVSTFPSLTGRLIGLQRRRGAVRGRCVNLRLVFLIGRLLSAVMPLEGVKVALTYDRRLTAVSTRNT